MYSADECPDAAKHTRCPRGYVGWHEWAETKQRTHHQIRCPTCGLFVIWVPRKNRIKAAESEKEER